MNDPHTDIITAVEHDVGTKFQLNTIKDAAKADEVEHTQTFREAFAVHRKAIFWSMALSGALIMEGYDVVVIGSFYGQREWVFAFVADFSQLFETLWGVCSWCTK